MSRSFSLWFEKNDEGEDGRSPSEDFLVFVQRIVTTEQGGIMLKETLSNPSQPVAETPAAKPGSESRKRQPRRQDESVRQATDVTRVSPSPWVSVASEQMGPIFPLWIEGFHSPERDVLGHAGYR